MATRKANKNKIKLTGFIIDDVHVLVCSMTGSPVNKAKLNKRTISMEDRIQETTLSRVRVYSHHLFRPCCIRIIRMFFVSLFRFNFVFCFMRRRSPAT